MLSQKQLCNVCLMGKRNCKTCRYLYNDDVHYQKWYCSKLLSVKKKKIDDAVADFLRECKKQGVDPKSKAVPLGDNCQGFPVLKHVVQGESDN
jgi:hypothetical protein